MSNLNTNMIAFERSIQISEGLFAGRSSDGKIIPIEIVDKGVRGQTANDFKTAEEGEKKNAGKSNIQTIEAASVPPGCEFVDLTFSLRVLGNAMAPHACDDRDVHAAHVELAEKYRDVGGFKVLAERYLWNLANARSAWRNRFNTDDIGVAITRGDHIFLFRSKISGEDTLDLDRVAGVDEIVEKTRLKVTLKGEAVDPKAGFEHLVNLFADALGGGRALELKVSITMKMGEGVEVFPSQEYLGTDAAKRTDKSRVYAKIPAHYNGRRIDQASMHSQKIGAALRWFDDWHGLKEEGPVVVNPYSGIQETGAVLRFGGSAKNRPRHFYEIRTDAIGLFEDLNAANSAEDISPDTHFFMANLLRGGVLGSAKADVKPAKKTGKGKAEAEGSDE